jgi:hypothetical protein
MILGAILKTNESESRRPKKVDQHQGKSLAGQRKREPTKGWSLRRGLDEAQTASVTLKGVPPRCGRGTAPKAAWFSTDSGEPAVSRPCSLWGPCVLCSLVGPGCTSG